MATTQTTGTFDYQRLFKAIAGNAVAIRCRTKMQPAAGPGTKVFPPTHAGGVYATEKRRIPDENNPGQTREAECVLLDSVQSQANRIEDALQLAIDDGVLKMPLIVVDWKEANKILDKEIGDPITSLTVPHRLADAILRDSETSPGTKFKHSEYADKWGAASLGNATPIWELCPTGLILGMWGSPAKAGGLGSKFARALVSEIVGIDAVYGIRTGSRMDPLQISSKVQVINEGNGEWRFAKAKEKGSVNPSEIGHSNIPPSFAKYQKNVEGRDPLASTTPAFQYERREGEDSVTFRLNADMGKDINARQGGLAVGGVTIAYADHVAVLSLPQLRRLHFPLNGRVTANIDNTARAVLASLALVGLTLSLERGCDLRSRCLLYSESTPLLELLELPGKPQEISLTSTQAVTIYNDAIKAALACGLPWNTSPITLKPSAELIELVKRSQAASATDGGQEGE